MDEKKKQEDARIREQYNRRVVELQSLFELSKTLNSSLDLNQILNVLLFTPMGRMMIAHGAVFLKTKRDLYRVSTVKGLLQNLIGRVLTLPENAGGIVRVADLPESAPKNFLQTSQIEILVPIVNKDEGIGYVAFGKKITGEPFSSEELEYLASMANLAAPAVDNSRFIKQVQEVNRQLDKKIQELNTLFEIGKELNSTLDISMIGNSLAYAIMGEMMVQRCAIALENQDGKLDIVVAKGFAEADMKIALESEDTLEVLLSLREPVPWEDIRTPELQEVFGDDKIALFVPMLVQDKVKGGVFIGGRLGGSASEKSEMEFLSTLANAAVISFENARLFEETLEKQRMEEELAIARDIQQRLLPAVAPTIPGFDFAGRNIAARHVGGDYYDYIAIDAKHMALVIGDVSGKGVPASLLMANIQASLHAMIHAKWPLSEMVARINNIIYANTSIDKFITFFIAIVNTETLELTYVNAGHNPPFLVNNEQPLRLLETGGLILGMMPDMPYEQETVQLHPDDWLILFTDGVSEAMNEAGEEFEDHRLEKVVRASIKASARDMVANIETAIKQFCGNAPQSDDITVEVMHVLPKK